MNKNKKILSLVMIIALLFLASACSSGVQANEPRIVRVAHGQPESHPDHIGMVEFKDYVEEKTNGKYEILIYSNELLGSTKNALELCQTGALEFVVGSASNMETFSKLYSIYSTPYIFESEESYLASMDDPTLMDPIYDSTVSQGVRVVGFFDAGSRSFYTNKPIYSVEDIKGMKIRVQPSPTNIAMMKAFEAGAVPMSYSEVYTAIQNSTVDGAENSVMSLVSVKHGEVVDYFNENKHQMVPDFLIANVNFLNGLDETDRQIFEDAISEAEQVERLAWAEQIDEIYRISKEEMGVEFIESDIQSFKDRVIPIHENLLEENPELRPIYEKIDEYNAQFRDSQEGDGGQ